MNTIHLFARYHFASKLIYFSFVSDMKQTHKNVFCVKRQFPFISIYFIKLLPLNR